MPYFYNPEPLSEKAFFLPQDESRHLSKTLRAKVGDLIHLLDGQGTIIEAEISNIPSKGRISCFLKSSELIPEPRVKIHLYIAPPRSNIMSSLIKQCVELGVWEIHLLECEFSVSKPKDKINLYEKEIISAAKQSGNPYFPEVKTAIPFKEATKSPRLALSFILPDSF